MVAIYTGKEVHKGKNSLKKETRNHSLVHYFQMLGVKIRSSASIVRYLLNFLPRKIARKSFTIKLEISLHSVIRLRVVLLHEINRKNIV